MTTPPTAVAECRRLIAHHSKSFALASKLLPADVRDDAVALYAWCRRADDAVDLCAPADQPAALARLEHELDAIYAGQPYDPDDVVLAAFDEVVRLRQLPRLYPDELLAGMRMDLEIDRYDTLDDLLLYCHRVAGVVGLMMCHVMGVADDRALPRAAHLGIGMQLTNISRDVLEDWDRHRLYLPLDQLGDARPAIVAALDADQPLPRDAAPALSLAVTRLLDLADRYYASGDVGVPDLGRGCRLAIRTARRVYSAIGAVIRRRDCDVFAGRAWTSKPHKLALAARAAFASALDRHRNDPRPPRAVLTAAAAIRLA